MAEVRVRIRGGGLDVEGILSTDRSESSYDFPVLVVDGQAYGPDDLLTTPEGLRFAWSFRLTLVGEVEEAKQVTLLRRWRGLGSGG